MTRSSPVGVVVLALAGLVAVGCSAQTGAALEALLEPIAAVADDAAPAADDGSADADPSTWFAHPHGYGMSLPAGWAGVTLDAATTERLLIALARTEPGLVARIGEVVATTGARASMLAVDLGWGGEVPPLMLVVAKASDGMRPRQLKTHVADELAALPGIRAAPVRTDERLNDTATVRFDYAIDDPDLGALRVRTSLFRFGGQAYLVSFVALETEAGEARTDFDRIATSLRFGI